MKPALWPPLESIQAALTNDGAQGRHISELSDEQTRSAQRDGTSSRSFRNSAFDALSFADVAEKPHWAAGDLITVELGAAKSGVLLDRHLDGERWAGWLAAPETCWASEFDVLLEPNDEPIEQHFAMIQAWNTVELECSKSIKWEISGKVSSRRLGSVRIVSQEHTAGLMLNIPAEPGVIALRTAGAVQMVLTGTPLGKQDPRRDYQKLYRQFAAKLVATQLTCRASLGDESIENDVRAPSPRNMPDFRVRLRPGVVMPQVQQLLRATLSYVVDGPDINSSYAIKSNSPDIARAIFMQSILVDKVFDI